MPRRKRASPAAMPGHFHAMQERWQGTEGEPRGARKYGKRCSPAESEARIEFVYEMLVLGYRPIQIVQLVTSQLNWDVSDRMIYEYSAQATERIEAGAKRRGRYRLSQAIAFYDQVAVSAYHAGEYRSAIAARREQSKLLRLIPTGGGSESGTPTEPAAPSAESTQAGPVRADGLVQRVTLITELFAKAEAKAQSAPLPDVHTP